MHINFTYHGTTYKAGLSKLENDKILVLLDDKNLEREFGSTLPFYLKDKTIEFHTSNLCHSDLFALNCSISKAIREQCVELF